LTPPARSWKEIAAHFGVDVRTCYRWEADRGLPVHRAENGEKKSPVFAYKNELDAWFAETFKNSHRPEKARRVPRRLPWVLGGAALVAAAGALAYVLFRPPRQPADFRIEGSFFIALDKDKRELWRRDTGAEDLQPESFYRDNFQVMHTVQENILPMLVIRDIDGDGDNEVVFALARNGDRSREGTLICWDRRGRERWRFQAGRALRSRSKSFGPDYRIAGIYAHDLDHDGRLEILVESFYASDWPCQLAVLDSAGKAIGQFWNSGYLRQAAFHDVDGDGREELIVCGVNNQYRGGCLIVFDTRDISGGSPQTGDFVLEGIGPGSMLYYVTTPYTDVSLAKRVAVDGLRRLDIMSNDWIEVGAAVGINYDFDFQLKCIQVSMEHKFWMDHYELSRSGAVSSVLGEDYRKKLKDGIRWWDGRAWSAEPTPVKR
jgi:hypothetical protein